jgi:transcriptional regulator with XRE-family HTH domain
MPLTTFSGAECLAIRERLGWTKAYLATRSGVTVPTISKFEAGNGNLRHSNISAIQSALQLAKPDLAEEERAIHQEQLRQEIQQAKVPTARDQAILREYEAGDSQATIASRYGVCKARISQIIIQYGKSSRKRGRPPKDDKLEMRLDEVERRLAAVEAKLAEVLENGGAMTTALNKNGSSRNQAIIKDYEAGVSPATMAQRYGVSKGRISQILLKNGIRRREPGKITSRECRYLSPAQCRAARAWLDWTQDQLAEAAGLKATIVSRFEDGDENLRETSFRAIQGALEREGLGFFRTIGGRLERIPGILSEDAAAVEAALSQVVEPKLAAEETDENVSGLPT